MANELLVQRETRKHENVLRSSQLEDFALKAWA